MRWSQYFINTLREVPADADVISQKLMMRAGMIRKVPAGIYPYLPLGLRSMQKLEAIVREEMGRAGAIELTMPTIQPSELWIESKRWSVRQGIAANQRPPRPGVLLCADGGGSDHRHGTRRDQFVS